MISLFDVDTISHGGIYLANLHAHGGANMWSYLVYHKRPYSPS